VVKDLGFHTNNVTDISPVRALAGLQDLDCRKKAASSGKLADLSPLQGMKLKNLSLIGTEVSDLTPLIEMRLEGLSVNETKVTSLSPLARMPLKFLACPKTQVSDLSPLKGMPLVHLECNGTQVRDLSPLEECRSLKDLLIRETKITAAQVATLQKALPNCKIEWDDPTKGADVRTWTQRTIAEWVIENGGRVWIGSQRDIKAIDSLPAGDFAIEFIGFDEVKTIGDAEAAKMSQWPIKVNLGLSGTSITDVGLRSLAKVQAIGSIGVSSTAITGEGFDAYVGKYITTLVVQNCPITRQGWQNIVGIRGVNKCFFDSSTFDDDGLTELIERQPGLEGFTASRTRITDRGLKNIGKAKKLLWIDLSDCQISDEALAAFETLPGLEKIVLMRTKVTASGVATLQKALPKCKIEWDDPAKVTSSEKK
jgi:hypothetical protein